MARLIIQHDERRTEYELTDSAIVVGRDPECELFFADRKLSRRHARFERDGSGFSLVDLESRNGSWVNEERIKKRRLGNEDIVRLGSLSIRFEDEERPQEAEEEATVYLTGTPDEGGAGDAAGDADATSTVMLGGVSASASAAGSGSKANDPAPPVPVGDNATRAISASELDEARALAEREATPPADASSTRIAPSPVDDSATRVVSALADDSATRSMPAEPEPAEILDDSATKLARAEGDDADPTLDRGGRRSRGDTGARTVIAPEEIAPRPNAGTVVYERELEGASPSAAPSSHPAAGPGAASAPAPAARIDASYSSRANWDAPALEPIVARRWTVSFAVLSVSLGLFALAVLVLPLASTSTRALEEETRVKGRLMMELLAAVNENALGEGRREASTVVVVENTAGVTGAFVLDTASRIVAPSARAGEAFSIEGLDVPAGSVRSIRSGRTPEGDYVVAGPVTYRGRRVGVAVVTYRGAGASMAAVIAIGCALLGIGILAAILYGGRMTLVPLQELRNDVDALARLEGDRLVEDRAYREVAELAQAINRLVSRPPKP